MSEELTLLRQMETIFDLGMYDASDTSYYLEEGYKVVAVEANPALAKSAEMKFGRWIETGRLKILNAAISEDSCPVELTICGDDLGSSSVYRDKVEGRTPVGSFSVAGLTPKELFSQYGVPLYLKVDLEGADRLCILALTKEIRPKYLSFEMGEDFEELLEHVCQVDFSEFKLIDQTNFREVSRRRSLRDRIARRIVRLVGYGEPRVVKRGRRFFQLGHSSGPVPWESDGPWRSKAEILKSCKQLKQANLNGVWFDLHAR